MFTEVYTIMIGLKKVNPDLLSHTMLELGDVQ